MLYQQYGQSPAAVELLQDRDHPVGLGGPKSRHDLIEQKQFRIGGERARQFQTLAVRQRESRGSLRALVVEIELTQNFTGMCARIGHKVTMQQRRNGHVLFDTERRKRPHNLKSPSDAAAAYAVRRQAVDAFA